MTTLLVLGGSSLARRGTDALAALVEEQGLAVRIVYALAGVTIAPRLPKAAVETRKGGFGGEKGLQQWMQDNKVAVLVDATHPFATRISENARLAARALNLPLFRLQTPPFPRLYSKKRFEVSASAKLPRFLASLPSSYRRSVLCALGAQRIATLARFLPARRLLLRSFASAEKQRYLGLQQLRLRRARCLQFCTMPSFSAQSVRSEMQWMQRRGVSLLICRDSGAREAFAKVLAAQRLSLPIVVLSRPKSPRNATTGLSCRNLSPVVRLLQRATEARP